jgi:hypothetical protein
MSPSFSLFQLRCSAALKHAARRLGAPTPKPSRFELIAPHHGNENCYVFSLASSPPFYRLGMASVSTLFKEYDLQGPNRFETTVHCNPIRAALR